MSGKLARDLMQTHLITVAPETPLLDVQRLFVEEEIGGAPVVDDMQRLLGVISSVDVLRAVEEEHETGATQSSYLRDTLEFSGPDWSQRLVDFQDRLAQISVSDAMTRGTVTVEGSAGVSEIARAMREHHIHRVFVVDEGRLAGVISTFDLVSLLED